MGAVPGVVLLLMLAVLGIRAAPSPEECHNLTKPVTKADVQNVSGDWVLVWYISDNISTSNEWTKLKTSYVEQRVHSGVIRFTERNMLKNNSCMTFKTNMTAGPEGQNTFIYTSGTMEVNGVDIEYPGNGTVKFFETCADCLSMEYSGFFGHFLLIYRRYGVHQNVEVLKAAQDEGQKLAECLGFSIDEPFIYDGVSGFCHKKSPEECHKLTKAVTKADVQSVSGDWVLVWSVAENISTSNEWTKLKSSHVELRIHSGVIVLNERNMLKNNSCMTFKTNMTAGPESQNTFIYTSSKMEENGVVKESDENGTVKFFETCADCLSIDYSGLFGHVLFVYRRDGVHQNVEVLKAAQDDNQKLAECLGFSIDEPFIYDGVSGFCHKKSSPEVKPEQD
ncbi:saxitoxin and tetrodotoxin-binding protein 2-like [Takifugu flavidus]|uniref:saxitoxin and tetrodotoxin-binding protein 2-like n=1 Tax=Takifugu flavidus TaxID=433684 RepID=UPI0025440ED9|nr:saxitoxin and tetrodotoxin-binding protein 2-like [Takifugu flavidus]